MSALKKIGMPSISRRLARTLQGLRARVAPLRGERGQATSESAVLLVTTIGIAGAGGGWLMASHPAWLNALSIHVHGFYYMLSLPFP